ncbi:D-alanyl-D-alanine carboxypeptidase family protein [Aetokthonos hydrillicola Thurmond2011]|jgi:hypothetical protein|uniref:D-alanyl-D-alanine carboxypeptidase family protein n=1 Tax=Aetokthonos hydrillicola Thurmond2011 TaxID=2712845 RepID=A0AAP5MB42_9CYAN|nr:D-alanyl-D-alanine carboxypeptidase family protein [Aetokthonos hydrillicola]MBO3458208.1 peptidase M15 [Aetokthonos hydrillicola CCALA 1050]MBW4584428.1 D-alanyl-D-alanine carboxypeptidase family protein [Aetokthonos hydrillicola CCALA 1050]MDR9896389.1 D-alanyl-D-alanine carboxypeptidase family protein [Aetokthonos hydrillicola Thurmond2011]
MRFLNINLPIEKHLKKILFICIVGLIASAIIIVYEINRQQLSTKNEQVQDCSLTSSSARNEPCENITQPGAVNTPIPPPKLNPLLSNQERFLVIIKSNLSTIPQPGSFEYTLLRAYGAAFVNKEPDIKLPPKVIFANEEETKEFQYTLVMGKVDNTNDCYLQQHAAEALNKARSQVAIPLKSGYGPSDCTRTFETNTRFWHKYANNSTLEKVRQGKSTDILGLVAPPGASQHLWGLAIDLRVSNPAQKQALNRNGWFQTVENDVPHWTFVGQPQEKLVEFGFKDKVVRGVKYWLTPL